MGIFDSKSVTKQSSTQQGIEGGGNIAGGDITNIEEFPDAIGSFADSLVGLAGSIVDQGSQSVAALGDIATREKTPLTEWLPVIAIVTVGAVIIATNFGKG